MTTTFTKAPAAVLDYAQDWTAWLAEEETILSHLVTVAAGLTKASSSNTDTQVTVWLSGGTVGERYEVTYRITTNQGRTDERTDIVSVQER